ncbi:MAG: B12-binding domain-containing radical SAM protein [Bacteroidetes bacterium]|nr:MAG: B12-binding domain-containing radical SAM protein [Bacteroidota bacterium]
MKTLIINSPLFRDKNYLYDEDSLPPIGLGLISTSLKNAGHDVELIDAVALNIPLDELIRIVNYKQPSFVGINVFTTNLELVKDFIETISFKTHFIVGGLSTQNLLEQIFNWKTDNPIDVVNGDGEYIICDIVSNKINQSPNAENTNRRFYKVDKNSPYFVHDISKVNLDRTFFVNEPVKHLFGFTEANIITSRGCIYNCAFCAAASSLNRDFAIREKDSASIVSEIQHLINIYPNLQSIRVLDDLFLKNGTIVDKAIDVFKNFNIQWRSMAHVQTFKGVSDEKVLSLKESGCSELFIGIESGSPKILRQIHKTTDIEVIKENLSKLLRNGINVKGYFIYGFPNETIEDMEMTYSLAKYLNGIAIQNGSVFRTSVFQFRPYHGTELYHFLENEFGNETFSHVAAIEPNKELSDMVGRLQFNFHSGNYSSVPIEIVQDFIYKTTNLTSARIFALNGNDTNGYKRNKAV